ncbi:MAG: proline--tRNA ligase [Nitrospinota bacterium]
MRRSSMFLYTRKEVSSEADVVSHQLMLKAGMIDKLAAGIYTLLPIGLMVIENVKRIVKEEMDRAGAQEVLMPSVIPAELWQESGRWDKYGKELLRIKDRHDRDFCYGPTHEEVITDLVRKNVRSYRQLPLNLYQIQTKFRDEIRPRFGIMRGREFIMKDAYSFDVDDQSAEESYRIMYEAYHKIFKRCGLNFRAVEADTGQIGGSFSHEFMVLAQSGEDAIASCDKCDYAANMEKARTDAKRLASKPEDNKGLESVETPNKKSVEEVTAFLKVPAGRLVKTLIFKSDNRFAAILIRGDRQANEVKLKDIFAGNEAVLANEEEVKKITAAPSGFSGPIGLKIDIIADNSVKGMTNFVVGGNKKDTHLINVNIGRDFEIKQFADIANIEDSDPCPLCDKGHLKIDRGIELGHIFKLGTKYSESMKAYYTDAEGTEKPMIMGCYGIGVGRTMAAAIEQNHDENGIVWPIPLAPFKATVIPLNTNHEGIMEVAEKLYKALTELGIETLLDDREDRAGAKFKDADLLGIPIHLIIGERGLNEGQIELKMRLDGAKEMLSVEETAARVKAIIAERS